MDRAVKATGLEFFVTPKEYVLLNSTTEAVKLEDAGECFWIPPRSKIVRQHPKSASDPQYREVPHSMIGPEGRLIPGTLIIRDKIEKDISGAEYVKFNAALAIKTRLGIDPETGTYTGPLAMRGISVVPPKADLETIRKIDREGISRWKRWQYRDAMAMVCAHDSKNAKRKAAGMEPQPKDDKLMRAEILLKQLEEEERARLEKEFTEISQVPAGLEDTEYSLFSEPDFREKEVDLAPPVEETPAPEPEKVMVASPKVEKGNLIPEELVSLLESNPKAMKLLRSKYNIRKRHYDTKKDRVTG